MNNAKYAKKPYHWYIYYAENCWSTQKFNFPGIAIFPGNYSLQPKGYVLINGNTVPDVAWCKHEIFFT